MSSLDRQVFPRLSILPLPTPFWYPLMARRQSARRRQPAPSWVPQPLPPSVEELIEQGTYERVGVTPELLKAQERLREHMSDPATLEQAADEWKPGMVGPGSYVGSYLGLRWKDGKPTNEMSVVAMVRKKVRDP